VGGKSRNDKLYTTSGTQHSSINGGVIGILERNYLSVSV